MIRSSIRSTLLVAATSLTVGLFGSGALLAEENPAASGFNADGSDQKAIEIADSVMETMGGRQAWDNTRYLTWRFFGNRRHVWDKYTGDIRVEGVRRDDDKPFLILMNIHSMEGRAWVDGQEVTDPEEQAKLLDTGEALWINDSYWLVMPYKLKDSGVTLRYVGTDSMQDDRQAEVLQLTFEDIGRTPENRYLIYVASDSGLVEQWDFFENADDPEPGFQIPWHDWEQQGNIMLSANRGKNGHTDIAVFQSLPESVLHSPEEVDWAGLIE